jgi:hypothetical protein
MLNFELKKPEEELMKTVEPVSVPTPVAPVVNETNCK